MLALCGFGDHEGDARPAAGVASTGASTGAKAGARHRWTRRGELVRSAGTSSRAGVPGWDARWCAPVAGVWTGRVGVAATERVPDGGRSAPRAHPARAHGGTTAPRAGQGWRLLVNDHHRGAVTARLPVCTAFSSFYFFFRFVCRRRTRSVLE